VPACIFQFSRFLRKQAEKHENMRRQAAKSLPTNKIRGPAIVHSTTDAASAAPPSTWHSKRELPMFQLSSGNFIFLRGTQYRKILIIQRHVLSEVVRIAAAN
jgi:hypothetical protein